MRPPLVLVTDDRTVAETILPLCALLGWPVAGWASSAEEAGRLCRERAPSLVLLDADTGREGLDLARSLDEEGWAPVLLASRGDEETVRHCQSARPRAFLVAPFEEATLRAALETVWTRHRAERCLSRLYNGTPNAILLFLHVPDEKTYRLERRNRQAANLDAALTEPHPTFESYFSDFDSRELRALFDQVRDEGKPLQTTLARRGEEALSWRRYHLYPLEEGEIVVLFQDVTKERRLRESQERRLHELALDALRERALTRTAQRLFDGSLPLDRRIRESLQDLAGAVRPGGELGLRLTWPGGTATTEEKEGLSMPPLLLAVGDGKDRTTMEILFRRHSVEDLLRDSVNDEETAFLRRGLEAIDRALFQDRTLRKEALRGTLYERALQSLPLALALGDEEGRIFFVNEAFERCTGLFCEEVVALPVEEIGRRVGGRIDPLNSPGTRPGTLLVVEEEGSATP